MNGKRVSTTKVTITAKPVKPTEKFKKAMAVKTVKPTKVTSSYTRIDTNIYKTATSYRVRVAGKSVYCNTKKEALNMRKIMKNIVNAGK